MTLSDADLKRLIVRSPNRTLDVVCPYCHQWVTSRGASGRGLEYCVDALRYHISDPFTAGDVDHHGPVDLDQDLSQYVPPPLGSEGSARRCEKCHGSMPNRTHRQRNKEGLLVCDSCADHLAPTWGAYDVLSFEERAEMQRREAEAITSVRRITRSAAAEHETYEISVPGQDDFHPRIEWDDSFGKWVCRDDSGNRYATGNSPQVVLRTIKGRFGSDTTMAPKTGMRRQAHDSGDGALINHCPFCGSGSVTGGSDGSVECDFCNNVFTVQVQPQHPNMPQTVDGQPVTPPGMPDGQPTEISSTDDPSVAESEDGVAANPLDDEDPTKPKKPNPFAKGGPADKAKGGAPRAGDNPVDGGASKKKSAPPWLKDKKSSVTASLIPCPECAVRTYNIEGYPNPPTKGPGCFFCKGRGEVDSERRMPGIGDHHTVQDLLDHKRQSFRTATGATLSADDYMAHLALTFADDREAVLDTVRVANLQRQAMGEVTCPECNGLGVVPPDGEACTLCGGDGMVMWSTVEVYRTSLEEGDEAGDPEATARLRDLNARYPYRGVGV